MLASLDLLGASESMMDTLVGCLLSAVCCRLSAVCRLLSAVCCLLSAACCLLSVVCCLYPHRHHYHHHHQKPIVRPKAKSKPRVAEELPVERRISSRVRKQPVDLSAAVITTEAVAPPRLTPHPEVSCRTVLTLLLRYCYTVVTLLLHSC
jgi:hypothetical protein